MKRIILLFASVLTAVQSICAIEPYVIDNLEPKPGFWKVRVDEISQVCERVTKGETKVVARTPLGYPVYAVFYGEFSSEEPQTNWSAANSSTSKKAYVGDDGGKQTILFAAGVHGSEPETVAAAMNIIQMLETGKDFRGERDEEFLKMLENYNLIIMPCVNMDGRSISPDHFRLQPYEIFRGCSQGWWKDGSLIGWRGSKEWFPLPLDKVLYPGGYPNADGYNIQHDVCPGDMKTEEAKAVCRIMARYRVDSFLNGHSQPLAPCAIYPSEVNTDENKLREKDLAEKINQALYEEGLRPNFSPFKKYSQTINLTNIVSLCSGGTALTLECNHSCYNQKGEIALQSFDQMMAPVLIALKTVMRDGLAESLAKR